MFWNDKINILSKAHRGTIKSATLITLIVNMCYLRGNGFFMPQS